MIRAGDRNYRRVGQRVVHSMCLGVLRAEISQFICIMGIRATQESIRRDRLLLWFALLCSRPRSNSYNVDLSIKYLRSCWAGYSTGQDS